MPVLVQVALGGALGATGRYLMVQAVNKLSDAGFPVGTMSVNILGSFALGVAFVALLGREDPEAGRWAPLVMVGILGGFTTFSAFSLEFVLLLERGRMADAMFYVLGSVILSIISLALGMWLARGFWT